MSCFGSVRWYAAVLALAAACHSPLSRSVRPFVDEAGVAPAGTVVLSLPLPLHAQTGAEAGRIGCTVYAADRAYVLERCLDTCSAAAGTAQYMARERRLISGTDAAAGRWYDNGPILHVTDVQQTNAGSAVASRAGALVRVVWEDEHRCVALRLTDAPIAAGTAVWQCREELAELLASAVYPVDPNLVGDAGPVLGEVVAVDGALVRLTKQPTLADALVRITWDLDGDVRVAWRGEAKLMPRAWASLGAADFGPFSPGATDDPFLAAAALVARRMALALDSEAVVLVRGGGQQLTERRIGVGTSFAVACGLRTIFAAVAKDAPELREFECVIRIREPG